MRQGKISLQICTPVKRLPISARLVCLQVALLALVLLPTATGADDLVICWDFGVEETSKLIAHGGVHRDLPGPRPPEFPDFDEINTAVKFDGSGAHYSIADTGPNSPFDFANGDAITLEAWVRMADVHAGENLYVVGKGRTGDPAFARDNQNWALRVREVNGTARVSFLFATPKTEDSGSNGGRHWHRWTSAAGITPGSGWHHIAVSYRFGDPASIRGWVDGKSSSGAWDMGGATRDAPVVDDDAVWIASSQGGNPGNSFRGLLDEIAIHRAVLADDVILARYHREGPPRKVESVEESPPVIKQIPDDRVLVTFHEGFATHTRWPSPNDVADAAATWHTEQFVVPRLPIRYDDWGIRQGWDAPVLVRAAADVELPAGRHRFLVRARGLSRLWVNGEVVAHTPPHSGSSDGHQPVPPVPAPPHPHLRPFAYGDREVFGEVEIVDDGPCRVILEALIGGKSLRPEPGEMCVAIENERGDSFVLLRPGQNSFSDPRELTDAVWNQVGNEVEAALVVLDDTTRRTKAASQDAFWNQRHALARRWASEHPSSAVPSVDSSRNPIDDFLAAKIDKAIAASSGTAGQRAKQFHENVLPVLRDNCFRCHGEKDKGGLRLDSREAAVRGGDSGVGAVVPGNRDESELVFRIHSQDEGERMPPSEPLSPQQIAALETWIEAGAPWPAPPIDPQQVAQPPTVDDASFLRRAFLDTVGVPPDEREARDFLADTDDDRRVRLIDRLLADERFADHWVSYWQDVLAENPNILKPSLNNSGPFRWFLYEALRDNKPLDRMVSELVMLRGGQFEGGSAGFQLAADNDAPLAAKAQILGSAFLGIELQCARCHDSPYHSTTQQDLYSLAAMLDRKTITVPKTSTVPAAFFEKKARESLIHVTLQPGKPVSPTWPFAEVCSTGDDAAIDELMQNPDDTRERLAALITGPGNERFARVFVNRIWKRLLGAGFVEPADDWEGNEPSHPELLDWLARELVANQYDAKHIVRLVMTSRVYGRQPTAANLESPPELRFFAAPDRRRLTAEQVVDSLYAAAGKSMDVEELSFDPEARRPAKTMISLGKPRRAWMFASLSNERDRPSLSLPRAQAVTDVLTAFGWLGSRQNPRTDREKEPTVLQPGVLANSVMSGWITRVSADSGLAELAITAESPESLVENVFLRFLSRLPTAEERTQFADALRPGFPDRLVAESDVTWPRPPPQLTRISWSTHLVAEANQIMIEMQRRARTGEPPDPRIVPGWREIYEDFVWGVINSPEFVWVP